jgi:hypothetical protein
LAFYKTVDRKGWKKSAMGSSDEGMTLLRTPFGIALILQCLTFILKI